LLTGSINVPMFCSTASRPASNSGSSGASPGAKANWRPSGRAIVGLSSVAASASSRGSAMLLRMAR